MVEEVVVEVEEVQVEDEALVDLGEALVGREVPAGIVEVNHEIGGDHETEKGAALRKNESVLKIVDEVDLEIEDLNREIGDLNHENVRNEVDHETVEEVRKEHVVEIVKVLYLGNDRYHHLSQKGRDHL